MLSLIATFQLNTALWVVENRSHSKSIDDMKTFVEWLSAFELVIHPSTDWHLGVDPILGLDNTRIST